MEIEIVLHKVKIDQPRVSMFIRGPKVLPFSEQDLANEKILNEAAATYSSALEKVYGPRKKSYLGIDWYFEDWFSEKYGLKIALALEDFLDFYQHLTAEAYAMYLQEEKDKKNAEPDKTT